MEPYQLRDKKILFAVLNWGLGHATRSSVLIRELSKNNELIIVSDGKALKWLKQEFPSISSMKFPTLNMTYSKRFGALGGIFFKLPHFLKSIKRDQNALGKLLEKEDVDLIISDNRYGIYYDAVPSILITHQLRFVNPFSNLLQFPLYNLLEKFDEIWVPDDEERSLSGILSKSENELKVPIKYIGALSRFKASDQNVKKDIRFLLIASGPEPHRTQLVDYFEENFLKLKSPTCIVAADFNRKDYQKDSLNFIANAKTSELEELVKRSDFVICRSGYSSIMDLKILKQKAILIPTPSQPEQYYLAEYHQKDCLFTSVLDQKDLPKVMKELI